MVGWRLIAAIAVAPRCAFRVSHVLSAHIAYPNIQVDKIQSDCELVPRRYYYYNLRISPLNSKIDISIRTGMLNDHINLF